MRTKIKKILFEYSRNSRITTKEIGKRSGSTQQSSSYLLNQLKDNNIIKFNTAIVDDAKLGFVNILVGLDYLGFDDLGLNKSIVDELKADPNVMCIERCNQGVDILVEYAFSNLSAFNKRYMEFLKKFHKSIETSFIFPVIVRHKFQKDYLIRKSDVKDIILCGDRKYIVLKRNEIKVLNEIVKDPGAKLVGIAQKLRMSVKTVVMIKRSLEKRFVIKGYSCVLNNKKAGIHRYIVFLKFSSGKVMEINKLAEYSRMNKHIVELVKVIGTYDAMIIFEELEEGDLIRDIRSEFAIQDYKIFRSEDIIKKDYVPLLV